MTHPGRRDRVTRLEHRRARRLGRLGIMAIDIAGGRRVELLLDDPDIEYDDAGVSPDGTHRVRPATRRREPPTNPGTVGWRRRACRRRRPVRDLDWRLGPLAAVRPVAARRLRARRRPPTTAGARRCSGSTSRRQVTRLTADRGAYSDVWSSTRRPRVYAMRAAVDAPPAPVRHRRGRRRPAADVLRGPAPAPALPGSADRGRRTAEDGTPVRAWLVLPDGARRDSPAPLLLWIHGGPLGRGTRGRGGGTRGCWPPPGTPCCCPTRPCRPATGWTSSPAAGAAGAPRRTPT